MSAYRKPEKRKHNFRKPSVTALRIGHQGIWVTCQRGKEGKAVGEMYDILEETINKLYPQLQPAVAEEDDEEEDIEKAIAKELSTIKNSSPKTQTKSVMNCKIDEDCVLFLALQKEIDPVAVVHEVVREMKDSQVCRTKYVNRLVPTVPMCHADEEAVTKLFKSALETAFMSESNIKYRIEIINRCQTKLTRDYLLSQVGSIVTNISAERLANSQDPIAVDLKSPTHTILLSLYKNMAGISVVKGWAENAKFNLYELVKPGGKEEGPKDSKIPKVDADAQE